MRPGAVLPASTTKPIQSYNNILKAIYLVANGRSDVALLDCFKQALLAAPVTLFSDDSPLSTPSKYVSWDLAVPGCDAEASSFRLVAERSDARKQRRRANQVRRDRTQGSELK